MFCRTCPGCLKEFVSPRQLPCDHVYCLNCLQMLVKSEGRIQCEICKVSHNVPEEGLKGFSRITNIYPNIPQEVLQAFFPKM